MKNYKIQNKQATSGAFTIKKINLNFLPCEILVPPIVKAEATTSTTWKKDTLKIALVIIGLIMLWIINAPRLNAYNDCYMENMKAWGSCQELGGGEKYK